MSQGGAIAHLLFNVVLEIAIWTSKVETQRTIFDKCSHNMAYDNDVVIMRRRLQDVKEVFTSPLVKQTSTMRLNINKTKTKFMIVSWKHYSRNEYVKLCMYYFETVTPVNILVQFQQIKMV